MRKYLSHAAYWTVPSLVALILYWPGLMAWFQKDDFAWLGLRDLVHSGRDLLWALFAPLAQGTVRTLSERVYFMTFRSVFGLHALPYRVLAFVTGFATLAMLCAVCTKLTRNRAAGFCAAILWIVNSNIAYVFSWTAIYYELLCSLCLLSSLWLLIRYAETADKRFYRAQWAIYLTGFLVLELNVVYPALALMCALCCAHNIVRKVVPLFLPAAIYAVLHIYTAPLQTSGPYKMYWNLSVLPTFWTYWKLVLGPNRLIYLGVYPSPFRSALAIALMAGLVGFLAWAIYRREWLIVFFASWYVIVLAPVLPLKDHITDYYLTIPALGLAMWGASALVSAWHAGFVFRMAALALLAIYLGVNIPVARVGSQSLYASSHRVRALIYSILDRAAPAPDKTLLFTGVNSELFFEVIWNRPFRLFDRNQVFLIREDEQRIVPLVPPETIPQFFISRADALTDLANQRAVLIDLHDGHVREISAEYQKAYGVAPPE